MIEDWAELRVRVKREGEEAFGTLMDRLKHFIGYCEICKQCYIDHSLEALNETLRKHREDAHEASHSR